MIKEYINKRSCAILGLGISNLPLAKYLTQNAIPLSVYDKADATALGDQALELERCGVRFFLRDKIFCDIQGEVIFRSPGIRPDRISIPDDAELTSEMELFLKLTPAKTFAVTGSDGKTTSTTLTGKFLEAGNKNGHTFVGGNIGRPLLCECDTMTDRDIAVLELSSFQLMTMSDAPEYAAITNISPNHLDWHTGMGEYILAKKNIVGERTRRLVTNAECAETLRSAKEYSVRESLEIVLFSSKKSSYADIFGDISPNGGGIALYEKDGYITADDGHDARRILAISDIRIPGRHNVENYMTAIGLTLGQVPEKIYGEVAREFFGVEHRLELVREMDGVRYYNSSIDSSPTRTAAALSALKNDSIVLICGGYDKKIPYAPLAQAICEHGGVHTVSLTGATGEKIGAEIEKYRAETGKSADIKLRYHKDFSDAVYFAKSCAREGDSVLLSPASASFDAFKNFAQRGQTFKDIVRGM